MSHKIRAIKKLSGVRRPQPQAYSLGRLQKDNVPHACFMSSSRKHPYNLHKMSGINKF